jgi:hypothetical protein
MISVTHLICSYIILLQTHIGSDASRECAVIGFVSVQLMPSAIQEQEVILQKMCMHFFNAFFLLFFTTLCQG